MTTFLKTTLMIAALVGCATFAGAQVRFGLKAGLNLAQMSLKGGEFDEDPIDTKMLVNFQAGVVADIGISENFVVQPGLLFVGKGVKLEEGEYTAKTNPFYVQLPVMFLYRGHLFYGGVGPYVGFGVSGDYTEHEPGQEETTEDIKFGNSEDDFFAPLDYGVQVEAGVDLPVGLRIGIGYALGLANVAPKIYRDESDLSYKHSVISVNVAYMFGGGE